MQTQGPRVAACLWPMGAAEVRAGPTHSPPQIASRECGTPEFEAEEAERKANFRVQNFSRGRRETSSDRVREARLGAPLSVETESALSHIPGSRSKVHQRRRRAVGGCDLPCISHCRDEPALPLVLSCSSCLSMLLSSFGNGTWRVRMQGIRPCEPGVKWIGDEACSPGPCVCPGSLPGADLLAYMLVHLRSLWELSTTRSMKATPRAPSMMPGKSCLAAAAMPPSPARIALAALL